MQTMTIPRRFRGPPNSGNGGYVCGMLARQIAGAAEVTLRAPPPLETELGLVEVGTGEWELRHGTVTIAIGKAVTLDLSRLERATYAEAIEAAKRTPFKPHQHLLPMCFVCGPDRAPGDGLRLFAGPLLRQHARGVFAVPWRPDASLAAADGLVAPEFVWSALDCPTGYVSQYDAGNREFQRCANSARAPFRTHRGATASGRAMRGHVLENRHRRPASNRRGGAVWRRGEPACSRPRHLDCCRSAGSARKDIVSGDCRKVGPLRAEEHMCLSNGLHGKNDDARSVVNALRAPVSRAAS